MHVQEFFLNPYDHDIFRVEIEQNGPGVILKFITDHNDIVIRTNLHYAQIILDTLNEAIQSQKARGDKEWVSF